MPEKTRPFAASGLIMDARVEPGHDELMGLVVSSWIAGTSSAVTAEGKVPAQNIVRVTPVQFRVRYLPFCGAKAHKAGMFAPLSGTFWRSVDAAYAEHALKGSVRPGRYSRADQPSLCLSSSREGVEAAMKAHAGPNDPPKVLIEVEVSAKRLFDLRDLDACSAAGIDRELAFADWQTIVRKGVEAPSWTVSDRLRALGAEGLIDPSRTAPGLWHLVLFQWNVPGGPTARIVR